jgi:hypothetical protein
VDYESSLLSSLPYTEERTMLSEQYHNSFKLKMQITPDDLPMYTPTSNEDVEILGIYARLPDRSGKSSPER